MSVPRTGSTRHVQEILDWLRDHEPQLAAAEAGSLTVSWSPTGLQITTTATYVVAITPAPEPAPTPDVVEIVREDPVTGEVYSNERVRVTRGTSSATPEAAEPPAAPPG